MIIIITINNSVTAVINLVRCGYIVDIIFPQNNNNNYKKHNTKTL